jgi:hypothetical protein
VITYTALHARFVDDRGGSGAVPALERALEAIGWRSVGDTESLAEYIMELIDVCVAEHHDVNQLLHEVARGLRDCGPLLDGGLPPVEAYEPAAVEVLERYVRGDEGRA